MDEVSISQLQDIYVPVVIAPSPWPTLLLVLAVFISVAAIGQYLRTRKYPWRREALERLQSIQAQAPEEQLFEINKLLRRIVLALGSADDSKTLSGDAWAERLNDTLRTRFFDAGAGRHLIADVYAPARSALREQTTQQLVTLIKRRTRWPW